MINVFHLAVASADGARFQFPNVTIAHDLDLLVERIAGADPAPSDWKSEVLPLNYIRIDAALRLEGPHSTQTSGLKGWGSLSFFLRPTRTGGTSAGAVRGIGGSPRYAASRPSSPLCPVFPLSRCAATDKPRIGLLRVATPPGSPESNRRRGLLAIRR